MKANPSSIYISAAAALALLSGIASAQTPEEIKVEATRPVSTKIVGKSTSGVPIVEYSVSYGVSLVGLNLSTNSGAVEAERRVHEAAVAACKEISRQYPLVQQAPGEDCAKTASDKAMIKVREMVAAAEKSSTLK